MNESFDIGGRLSGGYAAENAEPAVKERLSADSGKVVSLVIN